MNSNFTPPPLALSIVPCDNRLRMRSAVITGKYLPHILVRVLFRESGTVNRGRVAAPFRVHEKFRLRDVPWYRAQRLRHELLVRELGVVNSDLMTTKRSTRTTCKR